jgi:hypothetical protein
VDGLAAGQALVAADVALESLGLLLLRRGIVQDRPIAAEAREVDPTDFDDVVQVVEDVGRPASAALPRLDSAAAAPRPRPRNVLRVIMSPSSFESGSILNHSNRGRQDFDCSRDSLPRHLYSYLCY